MKSRFLLFLFCLWPAPFVQAADAPAPERLAQEMGARITRVPEFEFIREEAQKLGVKVYLFGGTAAAYGHYVRQDLEREAGDTRYPGFLYDYDYTNIFRSTQDLDVVVDGTAEQSAALESILKAKFPHFVGDKAANWEVRPLRVPRGDKEALLDNPNFSNQHTDSHSTGLVEITKSNESPVRDLRDWNGKRPQFLQDIAKQKLHYYYNPLHGTTERAAKGLNPPILSVIRYLTKAFQYDLEISGEDRAKIQQVIRDFDPKSINNDYLKKWVEKNGKKLFQHAVDIETAWDELQSLGLREKLIAVGGDNQAVDSLTWWLKKDPLRSTAVGQGSGKTAAAIAKEMGEKELVVAHEANGYLAWESITRSKAGELNALRSRAGTVGENALHGDGFYTRIGRIGARGTGFTVRMVLDPKAREGTDFTRKSEFIILHNKAAVRVIPEQINLSISEYFKVLADGKQISADDRALLESFKRMVKRESLIPPEEEAKIIALAKSHAADCKKIPAFCREYISQSLSSRHPEILESMIAGGVGDATYLQILSTPRLKDQINWRKIVDGSIAALGGNAPSDAQMIRILSIPESAERPEFLEGLIKEGLIRNEVARKTLILPHWLKHPKLIKALIKKFSAPEAVIHNILPQPGWEKHPELVREYFKKAFYLYPEIVAHILMKPNWEKHRTALAYEMMNKSGSGDGALVRLFLTQPGAAENHYEMAKTILQRGRNDPEIIQLLLSQDQWKIRPEMLETVLQRGENDSLVAKHILSQPNWQENANFRRWAEIILKRGKADDDFAIYVIPTAGAHAHPEWVKTLALRKDINVIRSLAYALQNPGWTKHPEVIEYLIRDAGINFNKLYDYDYNIGNVVGLFDAHLP